MSIVEIMDTSYETCHEAITKVFQQFPLDIEGKKVVIKPNVLRSAAPEEGITTHPAVLKAVIREVVKRNPHGLNGCSRYILSQHKCRNCSDED